MVRRSVLVPVGVILAGMAGVVAYATITNESKHRKPIKPLIGNIIFGNELPFGEDEDYEVKDKFVLGEDATIAARAYYPMLLGELWAELKSRAGRVLEDPRLLEHCAAIRVKEVGAEEEMFVVEVVYPDPEDMSDWDQQLATVLSEEEPISDFGCNTATKTYRKYNTEFPFPKALEGKAGQYECTVEFYAVYEGETGDVEVSWDKYREEFDLTEVEGKIGFVLAEGKFTLTVPE